MAPCAAPQLQSQLSQRLVQFIMDQIDLLRSQPKQLRSSGYAAPVDVHEAPRPEQYQLSIPERGQGEVSSTARVTSPILRHSQSPCYLPQHRHAHTVPGAGHSVVPQASHQPPLPGEPSLGNLPAQGPTPRTYAPYVTFPVAFVVGAVGYHLEWFIRGKTPQPVEEEKSILERREDRKLDEMLGKDHTQVVSLKDKLEFAPKAVLNRNRPEKN